MARASQNWNYLLSVWQKFKENNPTATLKQFAVDNGVKYASCHMAFSRIEHKQQSTKSTINKSTIFDGIAPDKTREIVQQINSSRIVAIHAEVLSRLYQSLQRLKQIQDCEKDIKIETAADLKSSYQSVNELTRALREIMPFILELKDRADLEDILSKLQDREYDVTQAALEISKMGANLPEALKIMLAKTPPVMIANNFEMASTEELDQRALEVLQGVQWQYDSFIDNRRQEVIELKKELQDTESFLLEKKE